jgi:hypothetical protein
VLSKSTLKNIRDYIERETRFSWEDFEYTESTEGPSSAVDAVRQLASGRGTPVCMLRYRPVPEFCVRLVLSNRGERSLSVISSPGTGMNDGLQQSVENTYPSNGSIVREVSEWLDRIRVEVQAHGELQHVEQRRKELDELVRQIETESGPLPEEKFREDELGAAFAMVDELKKQLLELIEKAGMSDKDKDARIRGLEARMHKLESQVQVYSKKGFFVAMLATIMFVGNNLEAIKNLAVEARKLLP